MKFFKRSTRKNSKAKKASSAFIPWRFGVICGFVILGLAALIARTAYIQVLEPGRLIQEGDMRSLRVKLSLLPVALFPIEMVNLLPLVYRCKRCGLIRLIFLNTVD